MDLGSISCGQSTLIWSVRKTGKEKEANNDKRPMA